ncbi:hypothetical protein IGI04_022689 [Brassica rapa subsp. trilocularis]|uniref:Uncharacterized protein n=1 Tax=Brassica rapa subsp. trilocularis TaxID=1813537 RepID=A0ABQ7M453_BRACM|nr:hypothetical protein IGI04_022689 [Brassica rapa subsp. trilocularis]
MVSNIFLEPLAMGIGFIKCNYVPLISFRSNLRLTIEFQLLKSDAKLANKVLIAKKKSIEEGAERFRKLIVYSLIHQLKNILLPPCLFLLLKSTVRGVMSDDVARFFNLLTTTQFWATMAYLSREYWKRRCCAITKSMENEIVVEAFMNFRTHTSGSQNQHGGFVRGS